MHLEFSLMLTYLKFIDYSYNRLDYSNIYMTTILKQTPDLSHNIISPNTFRVEYKRSNSTMFTRSIRLQVVIEPSPTKNGFIIVLVIFFRSIIVLVILFRSIIVLVILFRSIIILVILFSPIIVLVILFSSISVLVILFSPIIVLVIFI